MIASWPAIIVSVVASAALYPFFSRERRDSGAGWRISAVMLGLGGAIGGIGALLTPLLVSAFFGSQYDEAIRVVQIMCLVLPFVYASNLARLYAAGMERQVLATTLLGSLAGTAAAIGGQVAVGPTGAAAGYVLRQALFTVALTALSVSATKGMPSGSAPSDASGTTPGEASIRIRGDP